MRDKCDVPGDWRRGRLRDDDGSDEGLDSRASPVHKQTNRARTGMYLGAKCVCCARKREWEKGRKRKRERGRERKDRAMKEGE